MGKLPNLYKYAKSIRKEGESWPDAILRARVELYGTSNEDSKPRNRTEKSKPKDGKKLTGLRGKNESPSEFMQRQRSKK